MDETPRELSVAIDENVQIWASLKRIFILRKVSMFILEHLPGFLASVMLLAIATGPMVRSSSLDEIEVLASWVPLEEH